MMCSWGFVPWMRLPAVSKGEGSRNDVAYAKTETWPILIGCLRSREDAE